VRLFLKKLISFTLLVMVFYLLTIFVLANINEAFYFNGITTNNVPINKTSGGLSFLRFAEADTIGNVDVLFMGSSHCYRTFDTNWYAENGIKSFNFGSTSQSPLISYNLARKYLDKMTPELVVFEIYSELLRSDGTESLIDLLTNRPLDLNLFQTTMSIGSIKAWNAFLVRIMRIRNRFSKTSPPKYSPLNGEYVSGGFVKRGVDFGGITEYDGSNLPISNKQLDYLDRFIEEVLKRDIDMIVIAQPLPKSTISTIRDHDEIQETISAIVNSHNIPFYDFSELDGFDSLDCYYDYHHLNSYGVTKFNPVILELLKSHGLAMRSI
jgi:hypothetical protein